MRTLTAKPTRRCADCGTRPVRSRASCRRCSHIRRQTGFLRDLGRVLLAYGAMCLCCGSRHLRDLWLCNGPAVYREGDRRYRFIFRDLIRANFPASHHFRCSRCLLGLLRDNDERCAHLPN